MIACGQEGIIPVHAQAAPPLASPLGPFHFPKPLEIEALCNAEYRSVMPLLRYSGRVGVPYQVPKAARAAPP
jgi:hypothetical protein